MQRLVLICRELYEQPAQSQRDLAKKLSLSLGTINTTMAKVLDLGYITKEDYGYPLTQKGLNFLENYRVDAALFLAAGFGSRFVPLTYETPKGLLKVFGERMIERQIQQLHAVGITDITIAVGYLKEKFEYLIDAYGVKLLYNPEYATKNTLATLWNARSAIEGKNVYILSCDNWMRENMYHTYEPTSWYSASYMEGTTEEWCLSTTKKGRICDIQIGGSDSYAMYGPVYFTKEFLAQFLPKLGADYARPSTKEHYWEHTLLDWVKTGKPEIYINHQPKDQVYEFESLEELRAFDPFYQDHSDNMAMNLISKVFHVSQSEITDICCLKAGMTNQSFLFRVKEKRYICRIPGPGTDMLIDRRAEHNNYATVAPLQITEEIVYFNEVTGYKISVYYEQSRTANFSDIEDQKKAMALLRKLHRAKLQSNHSFDIEERILFYENLCTSHGQEIPFEDYKKIKKNMMQLIQDISNSPRPSVLSHVDSVCDNFLFVKKGDIEEVKLIDWEYAGQADPLIDIAMCCIYSYFNREQSDELLCVYLEREPNREEYATLYAYMALGGFLWTLWAIYKSHQGENFSDYTLVMYRYAKDYFHYHDDVLKM